jgi:amino acid permease
MYFACSTFVQIPKLTALPPVSSLAPRSTCAAGLPMTGIAGRLLPGAVDEFSATSEAAAPIGLDVPSPAAVPALAPAPVQDMTPFRAWLVLMNIIVGIGMLSIPYCFRIGIVMNVIILVFLGCIAFFSFVMLIDSAMTAHLPMDYAKLMAISFTPKVEWVPNVVIFIIFFGVGVLHLQYTYFLVVACLGEIQVSRELPSWLFNRWMWIFGLTLLVDLPLTFIKTISKFSRVSIATCFLIFLYLVHSAVYLIVEVSNDAFDPNHEIKWVTFDGKIITSLAIQAFAYHCHPTVGPTLIRLQNPTRGRQYRTLAAVVGAAGFAYLVGGLLPYLTLVNRITEPIVFMCYPTQQVFTIITKGLYAVFLLITTPLILFSARFCLVGLVTTKDASELPSWVWLGIGVVMLLLAAVMAGAVESLGVMFDFLGGMICSLILYIFPSLYYIRLCKGESTWKTIAAWAMIPLGVSTVVLSFYDTVQHMMADE